MKGTLTLTHRHHHPGRCQDDLVAEGVAERAVFTLGWQSLSAWIRTYGLRQGLAFASPSCWAPQGRGVSAEARAQQKTYKLLPSTLVEGLSLGLMYFEHQSLPRKDKSLTVREEPLNPSLEMSSLSQGSLTNVTSNSHSPYMDTTLLVFQVCPPPPPGWHGASPGDNRTRKWRFPSRWGNRGSEKQCRTSQVSVGQQCTGPWASPVRDEDGEAVAHATVCSLQPGFSKLGDWGGQNKQRVPMGSSLAPDPSTIRQSLHFLSWLLEQAGLLEPFLKRNQAVVAQAIFIQLC